MAGRGLPAAAGGRPGRRLRRGAADRPGRARRRGGPGRRGAVPGRGGHLRGRRGGAGAGAAPAAAAAGHAHRLRDRRGPLPAVGRRPGAGAAAAPASSVLGTVYPGVVPTALAFSTWASALARTPAGRLGVTTYLVPPLVVLPSWLLLDEVPPALAVAGGAVCLAGVALARSRGRVRRPAPAVAGAEVGTAAWR
ncbi:EamA family transporter [Geodermatophilus bullaregiensis]|uniref:EamA family transporter n=1 Tax=Geodermatophilus bullaregiensis TaxID=1564160 RepID=UPI003556E65D